MKPLRLLFVATLPEPGGAASYLISLAPALAGRGHVVGVVATPGSVIWQALQNVPGIRLFAGTFTTALDRVAVDAVSAALREIDPEHVSATFEQDYWATIRAARAHGAPVTLFLHHAGMTRINRLLLPLTFREWIVPSRDLQQWLAARHVAQRRIGVLYNPIDTSHFRPNAELRATSRAAHRIADGELVVGFVGRLEANKGVVPFAEAITRAMEQVPSLRAMWIGFGRREADVDRIINESPFAHRHMRFPWTADVMPFYAAMDLLALPSTRRESFGRVLVEAQSCALPVLGSDIGGIPETMHAGVSGLLVPPGDVSAWADALTSLCSSAERRRVMGAAGRTFVQERFDSAVIARNFEQLVRDSR